MSRFSSFLFALSLGFVSVLSANAGTRSDPNYDLAQRDFSSNLTHEQRLLVQVFMIAAGYQNFILNEDFNHRIFGAIEHFQSDNGLPSTGIVDKPTLAKLIASSADTMMLWNFRKISHPTRHVSIWVPTGLGLVSNRVENGLEYDDPAHRVGISYLSFQNTQAFALYNVLLSKYSANGSTIHYKVFSGNWFVISVSSADGIDGYLRYHQDGNYVTGFTLSWNNANGNIHAERIAILMSSSLWSVATGMAMIDPIDFSGSQSKDEGQQVPLLNPHRLMETSQRTLLFGLGPHFLFRKTAL